MMTKPGPGRAAGILMTAALVVAMPATLVAQAPAGDAPAVCYGFAFGRWTPALDLIAAGHDPAAPAGPGAPEGRGWATDDSTSRGSMMLFPAWWPAGVRVTLSGAAPQAGDTVSGSAVALVRDGRHRPPRAPLKVWGVSCAPRSRVSAGPERQER